MLFRSTRSSSLCPFALPSHSAPIPPPPAMKRAREDPSEEKVLPVASGAGVGIAAGHGGWVPTPAIVSQADATGILAPLPDLEQTVSIGASYAVTAGSSGDGITAPHVVDALGDEEDEPEVPAFDEDVYEFEREVIISPNSQHIF